MSGKKQTYRRLGYSKGDNTYKLTVPIDIVKSLKLEPGQILHFRNNAGYLNYSLTEDKFSRKMKLQFQKQINTYSVRVPYRVVEHLCFKPGQLFKFISTKDFFQYNPFENGKRIGVAPKLEKVNNLPKGGAELCIQKQV